MRIRRPRMEQHPHAPMKPHKDRPRRLFAALWVLSIAFVALWLVVVTTSTIGNGPGGWHSGGNHVSRDIVDGDALLRRNPQLVAADSAAMGRILLATHQRECHTGTVLWLDLSIRLLLYKSSY